MHRNDQLISLTAYANFGVRLGAFFYWTRYFETNVPFEFDHSNLSDQSALEIGLELGLDSELHYFGIFFAENKKNEHLLFRECHWR